MKTSIRAGALVIAVAAGAALAVPLALPASAALKPSVACGSVTSPPLKAGAASSTFSKCTPVAFKLGGKGSTTKSPPPGSKEGQVGFKVTWNGARGTTTAAITFAVQTKPGKCKTGTSRVTAVGTVKAVTGAAAKIIKTGEPVSTSTCVITKGAKAGQPSLEPGTTFKF